MTSSSSRIVGFTPALVLLLGAFLVSCDGDITGERFENSPPQTALSVRDESLIDNLEGARRFPSTVRVSWSGTDSDGFVIAFEIRFYDELDSPASEAGWTRTASPDSLVLLPIRFAQNTANVVFEARSIDNDGLKDPTPARTVFPIQNSPPTLRLSAFDIPPDETFTVFSFGWTARDPDGETNLKAIEISLNDSTSFVPLTPDVSFVTLVGELEEGNPAQIEARARVFTGRGFLPTSEFVPGLRLNDVNTFYVRAVDQTDTTSVAERFEWSVKRPVGNILFVNDYRNVFAPVVQEFHMAILEDYLPPGAEVEVFDVSEPFLSGATSARVLSDALPSSATPTLQQTFAMFDHIYWLSINVTTTAVGNNLGFSAPALDLFFENGGTLLLHTPVTLPTDPEEFDTNPAITLLPLTNVVTFPDSLRPSLRIPNGGAITATSPIPGPNVPLPDLVANRLILSTLPYIVTGNNVSLYEAEYTYATRTGGRQGPWTGPSTVASITLDQRVGLVSIPFARETDGSIQFDGADGDPNAVVEATRLMLESLGFPKR